jgi:hypothetical protein
VDAKPTDPAKDGRVAKKKALMTNKNALQVSMKGVFCSALAHSK